VATEAAEKKTLQKHIIENRAKGPKNNLRVRDNFDMKEI